MKRVASGVLRGLLSLLVVLVVLVAIFVGVARELVDQVDDFKPELVSWVNERFFVHLELGSIAGSWTGLAPRFTLRDVSIRLADASGEAPHIDTLDLEILLLRSLLSLQPRVRLQVEGATGSASFKDGRIQVAGFESLSLQQNANNNRPPTAAAGVNNTSSRLDQLLAQPLIELRNSQFSVTGLYREPVALTVHEFRTEAGKRRRYILGELTAQGPSDVRFSLKGRVTGSVFSKGSLHGGVYLRAEDANWLPWVPPSRRTSANATLDSLQGSASVWLNFKAGELQEILTDFAVEDLSLTSKNDIKPPHIESLTGKARWAGDASDWRLDLQDIRMQTARFLWMPSFMNLHATQQDNGRTRYRIKVDDMDIEPWVNYYLGTQARDSKLHQTLSKLRPAGQLQDVAIELLLKDRKVEDYRFALNLNAFQNRPWNAIPGLYDLDLRAWGKKGVTLFRVDETYLELNYPQLFRDVLTLNYVDANIILRDLDDQLLLQSGPMYLNSKHAQSATQMSLSIPKDTSISPFLQLQATLRNGDGKHKSLYLPAGVIDDALLRWLDDAIVDGHLMRGDILVHGPVRRDQEEPRGVVLGFTVRDAEMRFLPDWKEPVKQGVADVVVDRGEVDARILAGSYYGQALQSGSVALPRYDPSQAHVLSVRAQTSGPAEQAFSILTQSPLREQIGGFVENVVLQGEVDVGFSLDIPLQKEHAHQIRSTTDVMLKHGRVALTSQNLQVKDAQGELQFDLQKGLSAKRLEGTFLGGKLKGDMKTVAKGKGQWTQLDLTGNTTIQALQRWRDIPFLGYASGPLQYQTQILIPMGQSDKTLSPQLVVHSQLENVEVKLPEPFGKPVRQPQPFALTLDLGVSPFELGVQYGELANVALLFDDNGLRRGSVLLGQGDASLPERDILRVTGSVSRVDDQEWKARLSAGADVKTVPGAPGAKAGAGANLGAGVAAAENPAAAVLTMLDDSELRIQDLTLQGQALGQTDLRLTRGQGYWNLWLNNDLASGHASLPDYLLGPPQNYARQTRPVEVNLDRLQVNTGKGGASATGGVAPATAQDWQPADVSPLLMPPLDVTVAAFSVGDAQFGRWVFQARPVADGLQVKSLSAQVDGVSLVGSGRWSETEGVRSTSFKGKANAANAADAIKAMGGTPTLSSKTAEAKGSLTWPGAPFEFALPRLAGNVSVKLKSGVFYNVSSNAAGKLWGLLNFETLMRRLQLDFDDLSESDMVYDEFSGSIRLDNGVLDLSQVKLNSPAIKMNAEGKVDLQQDRLALGLDVTLPVTRNLVLPAAVIGGVPAAATAFVVEKMFGEQFDKLTTIKYDIQGTFEQPEISVKDSFSIIPKQVGEAVMRNEKAADKTAPLQPQSPPEGVTP
ncbi:YhdP family protein [Ketobacter sp.]|uniref:YhdP family protein n=1 Tax=Ketobacter sp. TaxID=2083498 RepID=UPI000F25A5F6|nr:YhdP family protein [Ketobacter sp.]RLT94161.1 MAG: TIGR02099 family protein [Ketobacter sp.]